ncbi:uncharacterized protein DFL_009750 [Arthrobotrys flagrans]|uniref:Peptidase S8/S53 domain-containing protein n=1 Tax=Arthrobotrys flagrans TaxID=97331 RepID=A0A436ZT45_ARTFL|nr:hypothetical protein DFL_009750 [Arthrobotrys flagrans]
MRAFILSASIIVVAVPASLAAPAAPVPVIFSAKKLNPEWYPVNKTYPIRPAGSNILNTNSTRGGKEDPSAQYIVIMKDAEQRKWDEVFEDMGFSTREIKRSFTAHSASGNNTLQSFRTFQIDDGSHIKAFGTHVRGFTMEMLESEAESMGTLENVKYIEKDQIYEAGVVRDGGYYSEESGIDRTVEHDTKHVKRQQQQPQQPQVGQYYQQSGAPWNLQRISEVNRIAPNSGGGTSLGFDYIYDGTAGTGVDVYMIDSGINQHSEFGNRARMIFSAFGENYSDDHGHGTHTAGTVGSLRYGVAKNVNLLGIKVLDSNNRGSGAGILAGMEAALASHLQRKNAPGFAGSVISMSIGGGGSQAQFDVLRRITEAGMHVSLSAMNDNTDACTTFPGGYSQQLPIFNVGATDINDNRASFSNFGACVNIHAPGVEIVSTNNQDPQGTKVMQGTSMACPAVSGVIALELVRNPKFMLDPRGMIAHIQSMAINGVVGGATGGQIMLNNGVTR